MAGFSNRDPTAPAFQAGRFAAGFTPWSAVPAAVPRGPGAADLPAAESVPVFAGRERRLVRRRR